MKMYQYVCVRTVQRNSCTSWYCFDAEMHGNLRQVCSEAQAYHCVCCIHEYRRKCFKMSPVPEAMRLVSQSLATKVKFRFIGSPEFSLSLSLAAL